MKTTTLEPWPFPDSELGDKEQLFKRYLKDHFVNGEFSNLGLKFSTPPSFNRSKFSEAKDVLVDGDQTYSGWGVLACFVGDVGEEIRSGDDTTYRFYAVHRPLPHNYAHSQLEPEPNPDRQPPKTVKKQYRVILGRRMSVVIESTV